MRNYQDHTGSIIKKHRGIFGRHIITINAGSEKVSVIVGKGIYDSHHVGDGLIIGHCGKKLLNIRAFDFSEEAVIWNRFMDGIVPCDWEGFNPRQRNAVIAFGYDTEMNSEGHVDFFNSGLEAISNEAVETALFEVGAEAFIPNFIEAYTSGIDDNYIKTDDVFCHIKPPLTDILKQYVWEHREEIFE